MHKLIIFAAALAAVTSPAAAQVTNYNTDVTGGFHYGSGNDYSPANATVLTNGNQELALRFHQTGEVAPTSNNGTYSFALGTTPISFDWSIGRVELNGLLIISDPLITVTNVGTGQTVSYNPFFVGNDNTLTTTGLDYQNSARLNFGFLLGSGFTPNVDSTYSVTLANNGQSLTNYAVLGAGATAAVPEPATWAMMLIGFGGIGVQMRRSRRKSGPLAQAV